MQNLSSHADNNFYKNYKPFRGLGCLKNSYYLCSMSDTDARKAVRRTVAIINGANLYLTGIREPEIYGREPLRGWLDGLCRRHPEVEIPCLQANCEGVIIDYIHRYGLDSAVAGIILNPGAYSHYSYAIADAVRSVPARTVEVHLSNIHAREEFRRRTVTGEACEAVISGCGLQGYELALNYILSTSGK